MGVCSGVGVDNAFAECDPVQKFNVEVNSDSHLNYIVDLKLIFPYYQGESTIFDKGNLLFETPNIKTFIMFKGLILVNGLLCLLLLIWSNYFISLLYILSALSCTIYSTLTLFISIDIHESVP